MERRGKNDSEQVGTMVDCTYCNEEENKHFQTAKSAHHKGRREATLPAGGKEISGRT
jgi:hypothetical protein